MYLATDACISECGAYRYWLSRRLSMGERSVTFVGLNPSTADAAKDDPTIRRCAGYARAWGFDWLYMVNLNAFRSTDPRGLYAADDPIGPENIETLKWTTQRSELVIVAWCAHRLNRTAHTLAGWLLTLPHVRCLGQTQAGAPRHPLYLPKTATPIPIADLRSKTIGGAS